MEDVIKASQEGLVNMPQGVKRLIRWMIDKMPLQNAKGNYKDVLSKHLEAFRKRLSELDDESIQYALTLEHRHFTNIIDNYCNRIMEIVNENSQGLFYSAFSNFQDLMEEPNGLWGALQRTLDLGNKPLYRIRRVEPSSKITREEMFHIPLNKRELVSSQRYSSLGYPCLYLGYSINACWEELERPTLDSFMVVSVSQQTSIKVIDLSIPNDVSDFRYLTDLWKFIMAYPLISACLVKTKDAKSAYKEEYVIPQMLTNYVIAQNHQKRAGNNRPSEDVTAIKYTSSHYNTQFGWKRDAFSNLAIPVINPSNEYKYCPILSWMFHLSEPTCVEYEQISDSLPNSRFKIRNSYDSSLFGKIEQVLITKEHKPVKPTK